MKLLPSLVISVAALVVAVGTAWAEYPPPGSTIAAYIASTGGSTATATVGGTVAIVCSVRDPSNLPVAGVPCVFTILSEPGTDASIGSKSTTKITGADGTATANLYVGTTAGKIEVLMEAGGASRMVTVMVTAGMPTRLPATGGEPPQGGLPTAVLVTAAGAMAAIGGGIVVLRRRAR